MFQFYLDNTLVNDPLNWIDFEESIERDNSLKVLLPKYEVKLTFDSGGYEYIRNAYLSDGFCKLINITVKQKCDSFYETILNGYIFISDCSFNLGRCTVDCEIFDNSYASKIFNNKNIKAYIDSPNSKNGVTITACPVTQIKFFVPSSGTYGVARNCFDVYDAFEFLVKFMSDDTIGFESTLFSSSIDGIKLGIVSGEEIRNNANVAPFISFQTLFDEINKKIPIGMTVVDRNGTPTIKIELDSYFYSSNISLNIQKIQDITQSFDNERLYSSVKFGENTTYDSLIHSFGQIQFLSFKEEEYHLQTKCNIDKTLDLTAEIRSNSNTIEEIYITDPTNDSYDEDIFFITYDPTAVAGVYFAYQNPNPNGGAAPYLYNLWLANNKVAERYNLAGAIAVYLGANTYGFQASKTTGTQTGVSVTDAASSFPGLQTATEIKVGFDNDFTSPNYDTSNNYSPATNRYYSVQDGDYVFETYLVLDINKGLTTFMNYNYRVVVEFRKYNSINVLQSIYRTKFPSDTTFYTNGQGYQFITATDLVYLANTDYCEVYLYYEYEMANPYLAASMRMDVRNGSYFKTISTVTGGGIYKPSSIGEYFVSKFTFDKAISNADYNVIKQDLSKGITFDGGSDSYLGWIRKIRRKLATSETNFELISNLDSSN